MESSESKISMPGSDFIEENSDSNNQKRNTFYFYSFGLPLIVVFLSVFGLIGGSFFKSLPKHSSLHSETKGKEIKNAGKYNILSTDDLSGKIKDTVYTDKECWLELKINEQTLYQHWRNGKIEKYPISSGNNKGGDPEALESRPGLFAIFIKEEHHQSSQFNASNMYHFMPFNQGIGFHSIDGTGYYAHLGVRPSSHGCIRMKHEDAKKLYGDCPVGTLVLATKGYSARAVSFTPEGFKNERTYTKDEYKYMLASNLYNLISNRYYIEEKNKFGVDPKIIPVSGVYTSYDVQIPDRQIVPRSFVAFYERPDKLTVKKETIILEEENSDEFIQFVSNDSTNENSKTSKIPQINSKDDLVKKYFNNPIGVLPYFGPKR